MDVRTDLHLCCSHKAYARFSHDEAQIVRTQCPTLLGVPEEEIRRVSSDN